jgi:4-hydroxy-tetrahydrodipicolinate synthase
MFSGALTAMVTPFLNGKVDESRLKEQIDFQIESGIDGLVPVGTTGESPTLDFDDHIRVIELTVKQVAGRVPVIGGVGANSTEEAIALHRAARDVGCDAGLSVNPYYNKPSQEGLYRHFTTLADEVDLPIVLYNIPGRTGIEMSPQTVARLAAHQNIVAMKEATGNISMATEYMQACKITVLSGDDPLTLPMMAVGATGVISVLSNLLPDQVKNLCDLAKAGNFAEAAKLHHRVYKLTKSLFLDGNPVGIKWAMKVAGTDSGELRLPLVEASEATKKSIESAMQALSIRSGAHAT